VIIHNPNLKGITIPPEETHAVLIVDSNAVLPGAVSMQSFELIARRNLQVVERHRCIQDSQFLERSELKIGWNPTALPGMPEPLGFFVPKTQDHPISMLTQHGTTVKQ
jgi:hypothetical protein